jgi:hypothetical protein
MQEGMQTYGELLIFCSSLIILPLIIISINSNDAIKYNVLAQPLPDSHDPSASFSSILKNDEELIEDIIDRQGQINEPEDMEPEISARAAILIMIMTIIVPFLVRVGLDFYHSRLIDYKILS